MTSQELLDGLASAGITTQAQVITIFSDLQKTADIRAIEAAITSLRDKRQEALAPIDAEQVALQDKLKVLLEQLPKPK